MAESGERRMLFDIQGGRRRNVIRVVYAILALLMGASLFFVVGPVNLGEVIGNSGSSSSSAEVFHEQAERLERRLAKSPDDEQLLLTLTRAQLNAGNAQLEASAEGQPQPLTVEARDDFLAARDTWNRYLKQAGDEANPSLALFVAGTFFRLAESASAEVSELQANIAEAARAQRIAAEQQPNIGSLSSLAIYEYFNGNFAAADKAARQSASLAVSKTEKTNIEKQLDEYRKGAKRFVKQAEQAAKAQRGTGKQQLQAPFSLGAPGATPSE